MDLELIPIFLFGGTFIGTLQWLVLRQCGKHALLWIPVSAFSWAFSFFLILAFEGEFVGIAIASILQGLLTGAFIAGFLNKPTVDPERDV